MRLTIKKRRSLRDFAEQEWLKTTQAVIIDLDWWKKVGTWIMAGACVLMLAYLLIGMARGLLPMVTP